MSQLYLNPENDKKFSKLFNESDYSSKTEFLNNVLNMYENEPIESNNEPIEPIESNNETVEPSLNDIMNPIESGSDSDIDILLNNENIMKMSDLKPSTISVLSKAKLYADKYNSDTLKEYIDNYLKFSVSKSRKGRGELVDSFKASILEPLGLGLDELVGDKNDK